ncbi:MULTISPECIES: hypothetical protein [Bradyrhizobium]|uniref:hypothetical protein n=1 Tax=Bradyrhizobium TaxID=374 RepID=UPI0021680CBD|nr:MULTISPECIES: hypothetical protein [Bradyrhizobium]MCS3765280.1 hypothetical protein [Bradyrhizobium centrosematis]MCS3774021.1 hypothetical protein [Bradyrhizobium centrosematis]MDT4740674.1 hypothetical protein [Bradyrhizobium sp. WYCCWR 12699]
MSAFPRRPLSHAAVNTDPKPPERPRSRVEIAEERLAATRRQLAVGKRRLRDASVREQGIRDGEVGRAMWHLASQGRLADAVIELIRAELRGHLTPAQAAAFRGTVFEP